MEAAEDDHLRGPAGHATASATQGDVAIDIADNKNDEKGHIADLHAFHQTRESTNPHSKRTHHGTADDITDFDQDVLHRGVRDAGRWAYGTVMVEVWVWNERKTHLIRPLGGWWLDPIFHRQQHDQLASELHQNHSRQDTSSSRSDDDREIRQQCYICRLTDRSLESFVPPKPLALGEGLPGVLWAELDRKLEARDVNNTNDTNGNGNGSGNNTPSHSRRGSLIPTKGSGRSPYHPLVWRQVGAIANDPDQPWNPRLQLWAQSSTNAKIRIGWAAAVPFDIHGSHGMVMYMARTGCSLGRLQHPTNENYLISAATLIGAAYALRTPRQASVVQRRMELHDTMVRVREKIRQVGKKALITKGLRAQTKEDTAIPSPLEITAGTDETENSGQNNSICCPSSFLGLAQSLESHVQRVWHKLKGGRVQPPPSFTWKQTAWTFVGVLITIVIVTRTNVWIVKEFGSDKGIVLGPFGAFMTLLYGLTAAPASQPRNALVGQGISMSIAIGISKLPIEAWVQQSLATSLAVTCMVKLGITHPPAGAAALLFATGNHGWYSALACLVGNVLAVGAATLINDINLERQYPTFWGIPPLFSNNACGSASDVGCEDGTVVQPLKTL